MAMVVGEVSAYDYGWNGKDSRDTTQYKAVDKVWLVRTAAYLKSMAAASNQGLSWFFWCFNANSHDTKVSVECSAEVAVNRPCMMRGRDLLGEHRVCLSCTTGVLTTNLGSLFALTCRVLSGLKQRSWRCSGPRSGC
jgi:hypothetical protein